MSSRPTSSTSRFIEASNPAEVITIAEGRMSTSNRAFRPFLNLLPPVAPPQEHPQQQRAAQLKNVRVSRPYRTDARTVAFALSQAQAKDLSHPRLNVLRSLATSLSQLASHLHAFRYEDCMDLASRLHLVQALDASLSEALESRDQLMRYALLPSQL